MLSVSTALQPVKFGTKAYVRRWSTALPVQFSFGICADIQYADSADDYNFQKTKIRRYRQSLEIFGDAVKYWSTNQRKIEFALLLGDLLDGKCSATNSQANALESVLSVCSRGPGIRYFPTLGNHDYYSFTRPEAHARLFNSIPETSHDKLFYDFTPHPEWRFISLDAYDISLIGASSVEHLEIAKSILKRENPNDVAVSGHWFDNLPRDKYRFVPYNGGIGKVQLAWFKKKLLHAKQLGQRCVIFCHQPIHAPDKPQSLLWNAEEVREIMSDVGNVALWLAGHDHDGQYSVADGIHHLVPPAPIECPVGETAYGSIDVYRDKLELRWIGREPSRPTIVPWGQTALMTLPPLPPLPPQ